VSGWTRFFVAWIVDGEGDFSQHNNSPNFRIENAGTFIKRGVGTTTAVNNPVASHSPVG
jgi:hypothetical protein